MLWDSSFIVGKRGRGCYKCEGGGGGGPVCDGRTDGVITRGGGEGGVDSTAR